MAFGGLSVLSMEEVEKSLEIDRRKTSRMNGLGGLNSWITMAILKRRKLCKQREPDDEEFSK